MDIVQVGLLNLFSNNVYMNITNMELNYNLILQVGPTENDKFISVKYLLCTLFGVMCIVW